MLWLYIQAPFAAFRTFTAGSFRPTAPTVTPSAAYGLLLNLAGIEMRHDDGKSPMTLIAEGLPKAEIAIGSLVKTVQHNLFQQLHNYPAGNTGAEHAPACKGNKYNITPVRRAFLSNLRVCLGVRGNESLERQILNGLEGGGPTRYGLPFLGDSNFLPDRIDVLEFPRLARWWVPIYDTDSQDGITLDAARLTVTIDRQDLSRTKNPLFQTAQEMTNEVPASAWVKVGY